MLAATGIDHFSQLRNGQSGRWIGLYFPEEGVCVLVRSTGNSCDGRGFIWPLGLTMLLLGAMIPDAAADDTSADEANIPVRQRARPYLAPSGLYYDNTFFYPRVTAGAVYDSNIYALPDDDAAGDWAYILAPELTVSSQSETASHRLEVGARNYQYQRFDGEDRTEAHARLASSRRLREDLSLDTRLEAARRFELRGDSFSPEDSASPIAYRDLRGEVTLTKRFNRLGLAVGGAVRDLAYDDGESFSGAVIEQGFRDGTILTASLKPFYDFSPGYRAFTRLQINRRDYAGTGELERDSEGYEARAGVDFLLTPMLFGTLEGGFLEQSYVNPQIPQTNGISARGDLTWLMTPLMTVSLFGSRSIAEMAAQDQDSRIDLTAGLRLDYEIRRDLIASLNGAYTEEDFSGTERRDGVLRLGAEIDYALNRWLSFGADYAYYDRDSNIPGLSFSRHLVMINVTAQY